MIVIIRDDCISNQLQSLELEIDISNAVISLSNIEVRVLPQLIYLREREIKMIGLILFSVSPKEKICVFPVSS